MHLEFYIGSVNLLSVLGTFQKLSKLPRSAWKISKVFGSSQKCPQLREFPDVQEVQRVSEVFGSFRKFQYFPRFMGKFPDFSRFFPINFEFIVLSRFSRNSRFCVVFISRFQDQIGHFRISSAHVLDTPGMQILT